MRARGRGQCATVRWVVRRMHVTRAVQRIVATVALVGAGLVGAVSCRPTAQPSAPIEPGFDVRQTPMPVEAVAVGDPWDTIGTRRFRHARAEWIGATADGRYVATASYGTVRWFAYPSGEARGTIAIRSGDAALSRDGSLAVAAVDGGVAIFDAGGTTPRCSSDAVAWPEAIAFSDDGAWVAIASDQGTDGSPPRLVAIDGRTCALLVTHTFAAKNVHGVAAFGDATPTLAVAADSGLWLAPRDGGAPNVTRFDGELRALATMPGGGLLSIGDGGTLREHGRDGSVSTQWSLSKGSTPRSLAVTADGRSALLTHYSDVMRLVDLATGQVRWRREVPGYSAGATLAAGDTHVLAISHDAAVRRYRVSDGMPEPLAVDGATLPMPQIVTTHDGQGTLVIRDNAVLRLDVDTATVTRRFDPVHYELSALAAGGGRVVAGLSDGSVAWWRADGTSEATLFVAGDPVTSVAVDPDGQGAAVVARHRIVVLDLEAGTVQRVVPTPDQSWTALALSPDKQRIVVGDTMGVVHAYDRSTGQGIGNGEVDYASSIRGLVYDASGRRLLAVGSALMSLEADRLTPQWSVEGYGRSFRSAAWSPDGATIAAADDSGAVWQLDATTGRAIAAAERDDERLTAVAWHAEDSLLLARTDTTLVRRRRDSLSAEHRLITEIERAGDDDDAPLSPLPVAKASWLRAVPDCGSQLRDDEQQPLPACATRRFGRRAWSLPDIANTIRFSNDGTRIWVGTDDEMVLLDARSGLVVGRHVGGGSGTAVPAGDGRTLAVRAIEGLVIWDGVNDVPRSAPIPVDQGSPIGVAVADGGKAAAYWYEGGALHLWRRSRAAPATTSTLALPDTIVEAAFVSADQLAVVTRSGAGWISTQPQGARTLLSHGLEADGARVAPNGTIAVWSNGQGRAMLSKGTAVTLSWPHDLTELLDAAPAANAWVADRLDVVHDETSTVVLHGETRRPSPLVGDPDALGISSDGTRIAVASERRLSVVDGDTLLPIDPGASDMSAVDVVTANTTTTTALVEGAVYRWPNAGGDPIRVSVPEFGYRDAVLSPNGRVVAGVMTDDETTLHVIDLQSGARHNTRIIDADVMAVSDDGRRVLLVRRVPDQIVVYDVSRGRTRRIVSAAGEVAMSADGAVVAAAGARGVVVVGPGKARTTLPPPDADALVDCLSLSPDGSRLAISGNGQTQVVAVSSGRVIGRVPAGGCGMAMSWDGSRVALTVYGERVDVWQTDPPSLVASLRGERGGLDGIRFQAGSNSRLVAIDGASGTALQFDLQRLQ